MAREGKEDTRLVVVVGVVVGVVVAIVAFSIAVVAEVGPEPVVVLAMALVLVGVVLVGGLYDGDHGSRLGTYG